MTIAREIGYSELSVKLIEAKVEDNPDDFDSILQLFETYVASNDYMKMNMTSKKIALKFSKPEYNVHSIQSFYMLSQSSDAMTGSIDLAFMFAKKHIGSFSESDKIPSNDGKLYIKIMLKKNMFNEALEFISEHPEVYSSEFEIERLKISILESQIEYLKSSNSDIKSVQAQLAKTWFKMILKNYVRYAKSRQTEGYETQGEFKSIYDVYEILIRNIIQKDEVQDKDLVEEFYKGADEEESKEDENEEGKSN